MFFIILARKNRKKLRILHRFNIFICAVFLFRNIIVNYYKNIRMMGLDIFIYKKLYL